ncbi:MAG: hypothetical protein C0617_01440 [Desulfuromonas sp.]|uniref:HEAT repeat domain-containing protein n=1 Tax=Desulfuromonas sp. TaxID=892 RepID=UPI000CAC8997|nr:HEAT repeat domain-containing protein [Desulfuromonas sp.]PLX86272.1 MAG: hypothetical protein C0617_01440 [Desulfuromonas sp.]
MGGQVFLNNLEQALTGLVKLIKAVQYYPPRHPSLTAAVEEARNRFAPLLEGDTPLNCTVHRDGFTVAERKIAPNSPILKSLAPFLFARRIHQLMVMPDLCASDLEALARCLTLEPGELQKEGGVPEALRRARVTTVWINEVDLARVLAMREEIEELGSDGHEAEAQALHTPEDVLEVTRENRDLERVIQELARETDPARYQDLLRELAPLMHQNLTETGRPLVLQALTLVGRHAIDSKDSGERKTSARQALTELTGEDILDFLIESAGTVRLAEDIRQRVIRTLAFLGKRAGQRVMTRLAGEENPETRRRLAQILIRQGPAAIPVLATHLGDNRTRGVGDAVAMLGDIRDPQATPYLHPMLFHPEGRIRREALRALTKIGGLAAVGVLIQAMRGKDQDLRTRAIRALGALRNTAAVAPLRKLVGKPDPLSRHVEAKKAAVLALGEIGSEDAVPTLLGTLRRRKFWGRARNDELRAAAAFALGKLAAPRAAKGLKRASRDRAATVADAAKQSLKLIEDTQDHEPGRD